MRISAFLARALQEHFGIEGVFLAIKPEHPTLEKSDEPVPWPVETLDGATRMDESATDAKLDGFPATPASLVRAIGSMAGSDSLLQAS